MQKMKASVRPEAVDSSPKVVHTASTPQRPTSLDSYGAEGLSTSDKDQRAAMLKRRFADTILKAQQQMQAQGLQGSKRGPEAVDSSKNRPNTSTSQFPKEPMRTVGAAQFSTSDKDLRVALLKSRFEDTIFKAQQEFMKASADNTQDFDLKNSTGSKRRPETVDRTGDSSKKRPKLAVHTTPTAPEEEIAGSAERFSTSDKDGRAANPILNLKGKAQQEMKAVKTLRPTSTIQQKREMVEAAEQRRDSDRRAARIALEKMTNTAGIELNLDVQRQFDILVGCSSRYY
ncbi:hypothetical protein V6N13_050654 [Hibiscus sabdariffa]|uniref:Uncharacterized protein n=1 Tax=Hibiscus sabdariffa TaxID=183260 RepID=A0ABR2PHY5_9ROSI